MQLVIITITDKVMFREIQMAIAMITDTDDQSDEDGFNHDNRQSDDQRDSTGHSHDTDTVTIRGIQLDIAMIQTQ